MRRHFTAASILSILGLVGWGCNHSGSTNVPAQPQIQATPQVLAFNQEFGSSTYIGTQTINSTVIANLGQQDLIISGFTQSGDSAFVVQGPELNQQPTKTVPYNTQVFFQVQFTPTSPREYGGSFVIHSNAQNFPNLTIGLAGCGVLGDAGVTPSYCVFDAGV